MATESTILKERLEELRHLSGRLADRMLHEADRLEQEGWPPSDSLCAEIRELKTYISEMHEILIDAEAGQSLPTESLSCEAIAQAIDRRGAGQQIQDYARRVLTIQASDDEISQALDPLRQEAAQVMAAPTDFWPREVWQSAIAGTHPWSSLMTMIESGATLDDQTWTELNTTIEEHLGRPLAIAAARGRLRFGSGEPRPASLTLLPMPEELTDTTLVFPMVSSEAALTILPFPAPETVLRPLDHVDPGLTVHRSSIVMRALEKMRTESSVLRVPPVNAESLATESIEENHPRIAETLEELSPLPIEPSSIDIERADADLDDNAFVAMPTGTDLAPPRSDSLMMESVHTRPTPSPAQADTPSSKSIFDDDDLDELPRVADLRSPIPVEAASSSQGSFEPSVLAEQVLAEAQFTDPSGPTASLATQMLNSTDAERIDRLPDLILLLIHEGRPGLAYHLAKGLESRVSITARFVPSWLIRTWTFSHALLFPRGQMAGLIQDDLQQNLPNISRDVSTDWDLAMSLMVRAVTLRPAIIAPTTRAASTLRAFDLRDGSVQLYNYCSRIGSYGERIQGVYPGLFKQSMASAPYSEKWTSLKADVRQWLDATETTGIQYEVSQPLFQKAHWSLRAGGMQRHPASADTWKNWQIAMRLSKSIVDPISDDRRSELSRVRSDVDEISSMLAVSSEDQETRAAFSQPEIRAYLRQALTFAQRWITLHQGVASSEAHNYLPQAAVELRSEIEKRHASVMEELQVLATQYPSFEVRMAVACLMLTVQEIRDLVDPAIPTESSEPDPRHLLHAELLKIPAIPLSASWEPECDPHQVEDQILMYLSQPQPDWIMALKIQLSERQHTAAERILSMSIWTDEEREALQSVLTHERSRQRDEFSQEVEHVRQLLMETIQLDVLPETDRVGFQARLTKLQRIVESDCDVSSGIQELDRLKGGLMKQREREAERIRSRLRQLGNRPGGPDSVEAKATTRNRWVMDFDD